MTVMPCGNCGEYVADNRFGTQCEKCGWRVGDGIVMTIGPADINLCHTRSIRKWHRLKCWPDFFAAMLRGDKDFDARKFDRDFQICDFIVEEEWDPKMEAYTGRVLVRSIKYILVGGQFGIEPGHCVLGLATA